MQDQIFRLDISFISKVTRFNAQGPLSSQVFQPALLVHTGNSPEAEAQLYEHSPLHLKGKERCHH